MLIKNSIVRTALMTFGFVLILTGSSSKNGKEDGWVELFNGKDLSGWWVKGDAKYEVINGEIVGTSVASGIKFPPMDPLTGPPANMSITDFPRNSFLISEKIYADFQFELELKVGNMNGGIQFRSESNPDYFEGRVFGYQCEVDPSERAWSAGIFDETRRGWLYPVSYNPEARQAFKANDWNHYRIEAIGNSVRTWLNGIPVAHVIDDMSPEGFFGLQVHFVLNEKQIGEQIRWRNIRIKTENLSPAPSDNIFVANYLPNNISETEAGQGWKLLFDGKSTAGFSSLNSDEFPEKGWEVKEGILTASSDGDDIKTKDHYKAFDLQFEFSTKEDAKGGIAYFSDKNDPGTGLEYLIVDTDTLTGTDRAGSVKGLIEAKKLRKHPGAPYPLSWNRGRIITYPDGKVEHWLNGVMVVDYDRRSNEFKALVSQSKYAEREELSMIKNSPIMFRAQSGTVKFRSIKIMNLN